MRKSTELLLEARDQLFRLGQDSASAYEHGNTYSRRQADKDADEIHARIDAHLASQPEAAQEPVAEVTSHNGVSGGMFKQLVKGMQFEKGDKFYARPAAEGRRA